MKTFSLLLWNWTVKSGCQTKRMWCNVMWTWWLWIVIVTKTGTQWILLVDVEYLKFWWKILRFNEFHWMDRFNIQRSSIFWFIRISKVQFSFLDENRVFDLSFNFTVMAALASHTFDILARITESFATDKPVMSVFKSILRWHITANVSQTRQVIF